VQQHTDTYSMQILQMNADEQEQFLKLLEESLELSTVGQLIDDCFKIRSQIWHKIQTSHRKILKYTCQHAFLPNSLLKKSNRLELKFNTISHKLHILFSKYNNDIMN
jgi:hypothetical protein